MISGNPVFNARICAVVALGLLAALRGGDCAPALEVPAGFAASVYARDLGGARDLRIDADGTLTLRGAEPGETVEITPPDDDSPKLIMRVATDLELDAVTRTVALAAPLDPDPRVDEIPIAPETLALARKLARREHADVALGPDGALYVSDARAGVIYRVRRMTL